MKLSLSFGNKPLKVRFPKRMCLSKNAIKSATQGTSTIKPRNPERTELHELKFKTETAENKLEKLHTEKSPSATAFNTVTISSSAKDSDNANAGKIANNTT